MDQEQLDYENVSKLVKVLLPSFLIFVTIGVAFYHITEKWSWFDSLWFTIITIATIGYGDFVPHTVIGKIFTMFYVFIGIGLFVFVANTFLRYQALRRMRVRKARKSKHDEQVKART